MAKKLIDLIFKYESLVDVEKLCKIMQTDYNSDVKEQKHSIVQIIAKLEKDNTKKSLIAMVSAIKLLFIQLGTELGDFYRSQLRQILERALTDQNQHLEVREKAAEALGLCTLIVSDDTTEVEDIIQLLESELINLRENNGSSSAATICGAIISSWSLLLTISKTPDENKITTVRMVLDRFSNEIADCGTAAVIIKLLTEEQKIRRVNLLLQHPKTEKYELDALLRSSFRGLPATKNLWPLEYKYDEDNIVIQTYAQAHQFNSFLTAFEGSGIKNHIKNNSMLRQIFGKDFLNILQPANLQSDTQTTRATSNHHERDDGENAYLCGLNTIVKCIEDMRHPDPITREASLIIFDTLLAYQNFGALIEYRAKEIVAALLRIADDTGIPRRDAAARSMALLCIQVGEKSKDVYLDQLLQVLLRISQDCKEDCSLRCQAVQTLGLCTYMFRDAGQTVDMVLKTLELVAFDVRTSVSHFMQSAALKSWSLLVGTLTAENLQPRYEKFKKFWYNFNLSDECTACAFGEAAVILLQRVKPPNEDFSDIIANEMRRLFGKFLNQDLHWYSLVIKKDKEIKKLRILLGSEDIVITEQHQKRLLFTIADVLRVDAFLSGMQHHFAVNPFLMKLIKPNNAPAERAAAERRPARTPPSSNLRSEEVSQVSACDKKQCVECKTVGKRLSKLNKILNAVGDMNQPDIEKKNKAVQELCRITRLCYCRVYLQYKLSEIVLRLNEIMSCQAANALVLLCIQLGVAYKSVYLTQIQPSFMHALTISRDESDITETVTQALGVCSYIFKDDIRNVGRVADDLEKIAFHSVSPMAAVRLSAMKSWSLLLTIMPHDVLLMKLERLISFCKDDNNNLNDDLARACGAAANIIHERALELGKTLRREKERLYGALGRVIDKFSSVSKLDKCLRGEKAVKKQSSLGGLVVIRSFSHIRLYRSFAKFLNVPGVFGMSYHLQKNPTMINIFGPDGAKILQN